MYVNGEIEHKGRVVAIEGCRVDVAIRAEGACASCKVKGVCGMGESEEKVIGVDTPEAGAYRIGEEVIVAAETAVGFKALIVAYIVPFLLMLGTLLTMILCGVSELTSGLTALIVIAVYYFVMYLFREKIEKEIIFKLRKTE